MTISKGSFGQFDEWNAVFIRLQLLQFFEYDSEIFGKYSCRLKENKKTNIWEALIEYLPLEAKYSKPNTTWHETNTPQNNTLSKLKSFYFIIWQIENMKMN